MVDPRQVVAAFLTLSMFAMLGNMIKNDHFSSTQLQSSSSDDGQFIAAKIEEKGATTTAEEVKGPWLAGERELNPCWETPSSFDEEDSSGYVTFSLTTGPEHHVSQVAVAILVARYAKASLVLPEVRGNTVGVKRSFQDIYNLQEFATSLDGVVNIVRELPAELAEKEPAVIKVSNRITEVSILKNIVPVLREKTVVRLAVHFPSTNMKIKAKDKNEMKTVGCLATFGALRLNSDVKEVADQVVERIRTLSHKSEGRFVSVDLRLELLDGEGCKASEAVGKKTCFTPQEVGEFLRRIGFDKDTTIYLTQTWWKDNLNVLRKMFPNTYTKDDIIPGEKKPSYLRTGDDTLERVLDFHVCSESDVFVPAISGLFYGHVAGRRIASGRTQVLVPSNLPGAPTSPSSFASSYVTKKTHLAYSCFC